MILRISIEQPPDHTLILRVMFPRLTLEELDTSLARCNRDLDAFVPKNELLGPREEIRNDLEIAERFVGVLDFLAHRCARPSASSRLRKSE
jgi:hypothetical protein